MVWIQDFIAWITEGLSGIILMIGAIASLIMYFALNKGGNIIHEYQKTNWAPFVLGFVIVGLEVGYIYAHKAGWPVSVAQIVQAAVLAVILIFVGYMSYKEENHV